MSNKTAILIIVIVAIIGSCTASYVLAQDESTPVTAFDPNSVSDDVLGEAPLPNPDMILSPDDIRNMVFAVVGALVTIVLAGGVGLFGIVNSTLKENSKLANQAYHSLPITTATKEFIQGIVIAVDEFTDRAVEITADPEPEDKDPTRPLS
jgi:hypothetical protein